MLLKHYCFTTGHHFDECRKLNIKNPLFNANGGFFVLENFVREGQARSPTKSEWDSANAQPYKHTDDCSMKSEWDSANAKPYKHTDDCSTKSEWDSAENLIDGADGEQSLR